MPLPGWLRDDDGSEAERYYQQQRERAVASVGEYRGAELSVQDIAVVYISDR